MNLPLQTPAKTHPTVKSREQPSATVVICTRNRPALLQQCLSAVGRLDPAPNEVLIVDNSEGDSAVSSLAKEYGARYILEPKPGLSRARNRGLTECNTDIVAFLDDDVIPEPNWLGLMLLPFADVQTSATAGRVMTPDVQDIDERLQSSRTISNQDPHWFEIATFGGLGLGANMAFRKGTLPLPQFFDERLGRGAPFEIGEESYAFAWILSHGDRVSYQPLAVVHHPPLTRASVEREARNSFAYWLLLFTTFPAQRLKILRFLIGRLRGKPLDWPRNPQEPGEIVSSSWRVLLVAAIKGLWLFIRTPKNRNLSKS